MNYQTYINQLLTTNTKKVSIDISKAVKMTNSSSTFLSFKQRLSKDLTKGGYTFYHNKSSTVVLLK